MSMMCRHNIKQREIIRELRRIFAHNTPFWLLLRRTDTFLEDYLGLKLTSCIVMDRGAYERGTKFPRPINTEKIRQLTEYYLKNYDTPAVMAVRDIQSKAVRSIFIEQQATALLYLEYQKELLGLVFIGCGTGKLTHTKRSILEAVTVDFAIAVKNTLSAEDMRDANTSLRHQVEQATTELTLSNQQLKRLDEAKNEFISMASHQLRTPLTSIKGYLDMLLQEDFGKLTPTQKAVLAEAFSSSERMVQLINDFLSVSRLQTGKFILNRRETDLAILLGEQISMMGILAKQRDLNLKVKIAKNLPKLYVDAEKLSQVMINMIDNALYYSREKSTIAVNLQRDGENIVFTVKDSGIGVPKSEQSCLFQKFFRASNARKRRPDGTGVGLFLARKIILLHGGSMIFESVEGRGSTFGFCLPILQPKR